MHVKKDAAEKSFIRGFSVYVAKGCEYSNYRKWNRQQKEKRKIKRKWKKKKIYSKRIKMEIDKNPLTSIKIVCMYQRMWLSHIVQYILYGKISIYP